MRIFLDENVDSALANRLVGHQVASVRTEGWFGITNGELLTRIERDFDVLISHDKGLEHQQNWKDRNLSLVVINAANTEFLTYEANISILLLALDKARPGAVIRVDL